MTKPRTAAEIAAHAEWLARHEMCAADAARRRAALWEAENNPVKPSWDDLPANAGEGET